MASKFRQKQVFPLIRRIIDDAYDESKDWVTHSEIVSRLLRNSETNLLIESAHSGSKKSREWWASNMVQWFSQKVTEQSLEWSSVFERQKLRGTWAYRPIQGRITIPEEVPSGPVYREGSTTQVTVNRYERDRRAREACLEHYGTNCFVCGFNFGCVYGQAMSDIINVHHLRPIATLGPDYKIDPVLDLRPVCPNCHYVIHRNDPPYAPEEVKDFLRRASVESTQEAEIVSKIDSPELHQNEE